MNNSMLNFFQCFVEYISLLLLQAFVFLFTTCHQGFGSIYILSHWLKIVSLFSLLQFSQITLQYGCFLLVLLGRHCAFFICGCTIFCQFWTILSLNLLLLPFLHFLILFFQTLNRGLLELFILSFTSLESLFNIIHLLI